MLNRRVLAFVVTFLQQFTRSDVVAVTKMPGRSLSMIWAPNLLRSPSESLSVVFANAQSVQNTLICLPY